MSYTISVTLWCEMVGCLEWTHGDGGCRTVSALRSDVREEGWVYREGRDLCAKCAAKKRRPGS